MKGVQSTQLPAVIVNAVILSRSMQAEDRGNQGRAENIKQTEVDPIAVGHWCAQVVELLSAALVPDLLKSSRFENLGCCGLGVVG